METKDGSHWVALPVHGTKLVRFITGAITISREAAHLLASEAEDEGSVAGVVCCGSSCARY